MNIRKNIYRPTVFLENQFFFNSYYISMLEILKLTNFDVSKQF